MEGDVHQHALHRKMYYTNAVKCMAEECGAFWLIDLIASWQVKGKVRIEPYQHWTLKVDNKKGLAFATDGGKGAEPVTLCRQVIQYTDFPKDRIDLILERGSVDGETFSWVLMLPEER